MAADSGGGRGSIFSLDARRIVIAGILGGIAIFLGATQLGFIPVPNVSGRATIMHIPAIVGGALEGPVVGALAGFIFGIFSWLDPIVPPLRNPLVSILPRIPIGIVAWFVFVSVRRTSVDLASVLAGLLGSFTNTVGVVGMAVLLGYFPLAVFLVVLPQAIAEAVLAAVVTLVVVRGVMLFRSGRTTAPENESDEERRY
ncbi:MAG: ECF transporter S component [Actinomycetota bacterium]|nr:ECF transporter S component [Actinomycetota bacterium]